MRFGSMTIGVRVSHTLSALLVGLTVAACSASSATLEPSASATGTSAPHPTVSTAPVATPTSTTNPATAELALYGLPQLDDLIRGAAISSLAGGPAGFVLLGNDRHTGALMSWTSPDGGAWALHWLSGSTFDGGTPDRLVGGAFGYLAVGWAHEGASFSRTLWMSPDGLSWDPDAASGLPAGEITSLVSGPVGAIAAVDLGTRGAAVATTQDGRTWQEATLDSALANVYATVALPDGFLVLGGTGGLDGDGVPVEGAWRSRDGLTWTADQAIARQILHRDNSIETWQLSPFGSVGSGIDHTDAGVVTARGFESIAGPPDPWGQLVGGPAGLVWVQGGDRLATCSAAWRYADEAWQPLVDSNIDRGCLDAAAPFVLGSASIDDAMLVIGQLGAAADRAAWLVRAADAAPTGATTSDPNATPPPGAIPDPLAATIARPPVCPSFPTSVKAVLDIAPVAAVGCFGDRPMTFRAWVVDPGEGYGGTCSTFTPAWIRECVLPDYLLAAGPPGNTDGEPRLHAMRSPSATGATKGVGRWVRVQGHYDDAVSPSCRAVGDSGSVGLETELPVSLAVVQCRLTFVVTNVTTVH